MKKPGTSESNGAKSQVSMGVDGQQKQVHGQTHQQMDAMRKMQAAREQALL